MAISPVFCRAKRNEVSGAGEKGRIGLEVTSDTYLQIPRGSVYDRYIVFFVAYERDGECQQEALERGERTRNVSNEGGRTLNTISLD
jgi:hypothetical protein